MRVYYTVKYDVGNRNMGKSATKLGNFHRAWTVVVQWQHNGFSSLTVMILKLLKTGFSRLLESPGFFPKISST